MSLRRDWITAPIFRWAKGALPTMSDTEREALEAGDTWWEADLFTGNPDWNRLLALPPAILSAREQAFLDGPVETLCTMLDDWHINWELRDLPPEVWAFIRDNGFLGMIIPEAHGGLGFSAYAHSEVIRKLSTCSVTAAVTVMVPNSLGPGELLLEYGTPEQQARWLPRLASGQEMPCFGLTSPEAGSDAASMTDTGVVCRGEFEGREVVGIRLNWSKRYITLGPVATVLGLAFKLYDPEGLLGGEVERGITLALVPTDLDGVTTGRRHLPAMTFFQNGPTQGKDVFVPLDAVIGGEARIGQGWRMLMGALAAGRGISLPSLSSAAASFCAHTTGAYARVREQFGLPIGKFEGIEERLARLAGAAYTLDAARRMTAAGIDGGARPAVVSAIMKLHATERMRVAVDDAMDVHAGKAVIDGPSNYLGNLYRAVPVGITVEGANILTRSLIVFGQGAIRSHPHLLDEMKALAEPDRRAGLDAFDKAFWAHVGHSFRTFGRALARGWTGGASAPMPDAGAVSRHYRQLGRYAAAFALVADVALLTMGGALKRREMISARLGDILAELYLLSAVLKRWQEEGRQEADLPVVDWVMASGVSAMARRLDEVLANLPNRFAAWCLKRTVQPFGIRARGPADTLTSACARLLLEPSAARDRLTAGLYHSCGDDGVSRLETAFRLVVDTEPLRARIRKGGFADATAAREAGTLDDEEFARFQSAQAAVAAVVAVDDFAPEAFLPHRSADNDESREGDEPSRPILTTAAM